MINLYYNYYKPDNDNRLHEINMCLYHNLKNSSIDKVILLTIYNYQNIPYKQYHDKIQLVNKDSPTFYEMLEIINNNTLDDDINIFCNSDIIIDEKSILLCNTYLKDNDCYALTRYNLKNNINEHTTFNNMLHNSSAYKQPGSHDTWIFKGNIKTINNKFNYLFGAHGCDSRFSYDMVELKYNVINPSIDIFTFHYHLIRKPYIRESVYYDDKVLLIDRSRLLPFNMSIQIKFKNYNKFKKCINSLRLTNYTGDILIYIKYKFNKFNKHNKRNKHKILKYCKINSLIIKKKLNKNNFYCKDNIIFNNPSWYNYYLNKNLSKYKIIQKHI
jgi:hypothetical protein